MKKDGVERFIVEPGSLGVGGRAGIVEHAVGLPGVTCETCGRTWTGQRVVPAVLRSELRSWKELTDPTPVTPDAFRTLAARVQTRLQMDGVVAPRLRPGDQWPPAVIVRAPRPMVDFIWTIPAVLVVSRRVYDVVAGMTGFAAFAVEQGDEAPTYFELVPEYGPIALLERASSRCPECAYPEVTRDPGVVPDTDMYYVGYSLRIAVSSRFKHAVEKLSPVNVSWL